LHVLIDAYNLDLREGTGIATYTRNLDHALRLLGCRTSLLFARETAPDSDALVREVAFWGAHTTPAGGRAGQILRAFRRAFAVFDGARAAESIPPSRFVVLRPEERYEGAIVNAPALFEDAFRRYAFMRKFVQVTPPERVDVAHLTYPIPVRVRGAKIVTTIHDLVPLRLPYATMDRKREIVRRHRDVAERSDLLLTVSEASKRDIVNLLDIDPERVCVTYQTTDIQPLRPVEAKNLGRIVGRYGLEPQGYALFVSAIEPKKNLRRLLRAYLDLDPPMPLVVVGKRAWMAKEELGEALAALELRKRKSIIFLDYVPREDLRYLYAGAICMLFPSLYEGFGLPLLEAMQFGVPMLTSNTSSMPEVAGEAALYVDPYDVEDIRNKIERLLTDEALRTWLSQKALEQAQLFTVERYQQALGGAYARIL
jgi:glycosyltransferase involved in cell wall biosynthesis